MLALSGDEYIAHAPLEGANGAELARQGYVVRVYDDMLTIERREFGEGGRLGADWVMPFGQFNPHPFLKGELKKVIGEPQFRKGAKLEVENVANVEILPNANIQSQLETDNIGIGNTGNIGNIVIKIPLADGNPDSRVYAYEVVAVGDEGAQRLFKAVYAAGVNLGMGHEPKGGVTTLDIPMSELPTGKTLTIAVRPLTSLVPVEVKARSGTSKSLKTLISSDHYPDIRFGVKLHAGNIGFSDGIWTFPLFCAFLLPDVLPQLPRQ